MIEHVLLILASLATIMLGLLCLWRGQERKQMETVSLTFQTLAENSPAGIWRTDAQGHCIYVNRAWEEMAGMHNGEWHGAGWGEALHLDDREQVMGKFSQAVIRHEKFEEELRWQHPDGSVIWVRTLCAPEFDKSGKLVGYVGINISIQDSKQLEEELSSALTRSEQAAAAKTSFLANMSHEIRTPMNGVIGFTELLLDSDMPEEQRNRVQLIADSGRAMMRLLNDILDVAKIESGTLLIKYEPTDVRQKLRHSAKLLEPLARSKHLSLGVWVDDAVPELVELDALRLRQIILNLVGNAVKFTQVGGIDVEARVENSSDGRHLLFSVIDTGIGIDQSRIEAIFMPFTQEDSSAARRQGGSGLGLSISNQLVTMMGGTITVHSRLGVGTNFTVRLPLREVASSKQRDSIRSHTTPPALPHFEGARLLIAEDHAINQQLIIAMTTSLGLQAQLVENGEQAIAAVVDAEQTGKPFDAILMDVQMPDMDGLEASRRLRKMGYGPDRLPIIALTANCYPDDIEACRRAGMQSHLGKPVTTLALARELARCLPDKARVEIEARTADGSTLSKGLDPAIAGLEGRYLDRKGTLFSSMRRFMEDDPEAVDWDRLTGELHKLAGIAANFGEAELGEASRRLERRLRLTSEPHLRLAALRREWPCFEAAA